jgi:GNAT superfamily N-acetyltransferase
MVTSDIQAGLRLCRASGWNQLEHDWAAFLDFSPGGCRVAEKNGKVVGTVTTLRYQERFSWLSMVLVDPAERGAGIGTRLLQEGLRLLKQENCVRLDATPLGRPIYERHGFIEEFPLKRMAVSTGASKPVPLSNRIRPMRESDLTSVFAWDRDVFGADRSLLLRSWLQLAPGCAFIADGGGVEGYCFGRPGYKYSQIGPIVAKNEMIAGELISECLRRATNDTFAIDAPAISAEWVAQLAALGFVEERPFTRMSRGGNLRASPCASLFAIAGPEFG